MTRRSLEQVAADFDVAAAPTVYTARNVDRSAMQGPDDVTPLLTPAARRQGVRGEVLVQFIVGENGSIQNSSMRILRSDDLAQQMAVVMALNRATFVPAQRHGRPVAQVIQRLYVFDPSRAR